MVTAGLVWPRSTIAERVAIKTLDFEDNTADLSRSDWTSRVLFKETVQGPFGLELSVTEHLSNDQVREFVKFMGSSVLKLTGAEAGDLVESSMGAGLVKLPFQYLGKLVAGSSRKSAGVVGAGTVDLCADGGWKVNEVVRVEIPLVTPETIYMTARTRKHGELSSRRRTLLKAGRENGVAVLTARVYD